MIFYRPALFLFACGLLLLAFPSWGIGADSGSTVLSLDLSQTLELALQNNPDLQAKRQALGRAQGRVQQAELLFQENPQLSVDADYRQRRFAAPTGTSAADVEVRLLQEIEVAGQRGHRREAAAKNLAEAQWLVADAERLLRWRTTKAFYALLATQERITVQEQILATQDALFHAGQERFARGDISVLEHDTLRFDRDKVYTELVGEQDKRVRQEQQLRSLLGVKEDTPLVAAGNLRSLSTRRMEINKHVSLEKLKACALETRPDVEAMNLNLQVREAELRLAQAQRVPNISVGPLYKLDNEDQVIGGSITVPLPFYNRNQREIAAALADLQVARTHVTARRLAVRQEVAAVHERLRLAEERIAAYGPAYLEEVQQSSRFTRKAYQAGEMDIFEFSTVQERLTQTRLQYGEMLLAYLQAMAALEAQAPGCLVQIDTMWHADRSFHLSGSSAQELD